MDLVAFQLGMLLGRSEHDNPPLPIDRTGEFPTLLRGVPEELFEHGNHILEGVFVVVPEHDMVARLSLGLAARLLPGRLSAVGGQRGHRVAGGGVCLGLLNLGLLDLGFLDRTDGGGCSGGEGHRSGTLPGEFTAQATVYARRRTPGDPPVLDRRFVADNIELVTTNCRLRGSSADVARFADLDRLRRQLQADIDRLNQAAGLVSKSIGKAADAAERDAQKAEGRRLREEIGALEVRQATIIAESDEILRAIPNLTHPDSPTGGEDAAVEIRRGKAPIPQFTFKPADHVALGANLKLFDFDAGSKVAGHGFYFLTNDGVLLELALTRYCIDILQRKGFTVMTTPDVARDSILEGTGFMPRGPETQIYSITGSDLSLVATAEITLGGAMHERIFEAEELPLKLVGISHCFRTEAGAHGRATRGLYRVHQFTKVEMFAFTLPEQSESMHGELLELECELFDGLGIPYRVIDTPSGDLGGPAYRKFDLEAWMPGRGAGGEWGEVTSTSNCTDYQARRLAIRYRKPGEKGTQFVHTLNGTAIAMSRAIIAIVENFQQADGTVAVPDALVAWMGKQTMAAPTRGGGLSPEKPS